MSWFERLCILYDSMTWDIPLYHEPRRANIIISLDGEGSFLGARQCGITAAVPVTMRSSVRTSAVCPHPLFDTLSYIAGDHSEYLPEKEPASVSAKYTAYLEQLGQWAASQYSTPELFAVYRCVLRGKLFGELSAAGAVKCAPKEAGALFAIFEVDGNTLWKDNALRERYIELCRANAENVCLCSGTGRMEQPTETHPKGILSENSAAKLISANENGRILFSDRFRNVSEAAPVGWESSMKAHRALTRLLKEAGAAVDSEQYAAFTSDGIMLPLGELFYGGNFEMLLCGSAARSDDIVTVIALSEYTKGRASVTFYRELPRRVFDAAIKSYADSGGLPISKAVDIGMGSSGKALRIFTKQRELLCRRLLGKILDGA